MLRAAVEVDLVAVYSLAIFYGLSFICCILQADFLGILIWHLILQRNELPYRAVVNLPYKSLGYVDCPPFK